MLAKILPDRRSGNTILSKGDNSNDIIVSHAAFYYPPSIHILSSAPCKQFGSRSGPSNVGPDLDPNCSNDILMVFLK